MLQRLLNRFKRLDESLGDWRLGISTTEHHRQYNKDHPEFRGYAPTTFRDWRIIRRHIKPDPKSSFIDYGAGLGRVTILAARLPFRRVIGVEFDRDLVSRAEINVRDAQTSLRAPVEIICADAATFDVPTDASTLFFCNPFTGSVLFGALARARASFEAKPRPMRLTCNLPDRSAFEEEIATFEWLRLVNNISLSEKRKCLVYQPISQQAS